MKALWIAIGNPLRGDDGVAHRAVELAGRLPGVTVRHEVQLAPELAPAIAAAASVVFIDAGFNDEVVLHTLEPEAGASVLSHQMTPQVLLYLARTLYNFQGSAFLCEIPVESFEPGAPLSARAATEARAASKLLAHFGMVGPEDAQCKKAASCG